MKTTPAAHQSNEGNASAVTGVSRISMGAAALGSVFTLPVAVDAAIVYSGLQNINVTLPVNERNASNSVPGGNSEAIGLDLDNNGSADFNLRVRQSVGNFGVGSAELEGLGPNMVAINSPDGFEARNFSESNVVNPELASLAKYGLLRQAAGFSSPSTTYTSGPAIVANPNSAIGDFSPSQNGIAGVLFDIGGNTHYGWIRLHVENGDSGFPVGVTAIDWAYSSQPIHVADVPEANPGLVLLAAGGTGLVAWRLRRRKEAK